MFRPMRRHRQLLAQEECIDILRRGNYGVLALLGDAGYPYTVPLNYVYEDGKIYFHAAKTGHKMDALQACDKVSFCVVGEEQVVEEKLTDFFKSVVVFGRLRLLTEKEEMVRALRLLGLKYSRNAPLVEREARGSLDEVACLALTVEHMTGKEAMEFVRRRERGE